MKKTFTKPLIALAALGVIGAGAGVGALASAQTANTASDAPTQVGGGMMGGGMHRMGDMEHHRGAGGTVTAISGNTITITGDNGTTYTVDATNAKVSKVVDLTVGDIKVGDHIGAMGTLSGTVVTAKHIMDGIPPAPKDIQDSNN